MRFELRPKALALLVLFVGVVPGCQAPRMGKPLTKQLASSDPDAQIEFWHQLADQTITTNDEAFHGLLLYLDGKDDSADYAARVATMKSRKLLDGGFDEPAEAALRRGTLAVAVVKLIQTRG